MQIQLFNEAVAIPVATAAGFASVEEYVNPFIKQTADLEAIRAGLDDARSGRVSPLEEFDRAFRAKMAFAKRIGS